MELYKKKSLQFSGFSREIKKKELITFRQAAKTKRLSTLRDFSNIEDNVEDKDYKIVEDKKKKTGIPSRVDMLKKWKEEKMIKQQKEQLAKKPVFKVGFVAKKSSSFLVPDASEDKSKSLSFKVPEVSSHSCNLNKSKKHDNQTTKVCEENSSRLKKEIFRPATLKPPSQISKSVAPVSQVKSTASSLPKPSIQTSTSKSSILKTMSSVTKSSVPSSKSAISALKPIVLTSKSTASAEKPTVSISKSVTSRVYQGSKPGILASKTTAPSLKSTKQTLKAPYPSKMIPSVQNKHVVAASKQFSLKQNQKPPSSKTGHSAEAQNRNAIKPNALPKNIDQKPTKNNATVKKDTQYNEDSESIFNCDISCIEPNESVRNSFAPRNFLFCPPVELSSFGYNFESSIFSKIKNQENTQRTSSPLKLSVQEREPQLETDETCVPSKDVIEVETESTRSSLLKLSVQEKVLQLETDEACVPSKEVIEVETENARSSPLKSPLLNTKQEFKIEANSPSGDDSVFEPKSTLADISEKLVVLQAEEPRPYFNRSETIANKEETKDSSLTLLNIEENLKDPISIENSLIRNDSDSCVPQKPFVLAVPNENFMESTENLNEKSEFSESSQSSVNDLVSLSDTLKSFKNLDLSLSESKQLDITKNYKKSKPVLESINESLETKSLDTTPKLTKKKKQLDENFTPRRSARLSQKLRKSNSFESLIKLTPKEEINKPSTSRPLLERINFDSDSKSKNSSCRKKSLLVQSLTSRRSARLSKKSSSSFESLLDVARPSIMGSLDMDESFEARETHTHITYDFENLHLENTSEAKNLQPSKATDRVSLLYTPPHRRKQSTRNSIKEDLMSFSPF